MEGSAVNGVVTAASDAGHRDVASHDVMRPSWAPISTKELVPSGYQSITRMQTRGPCWAHESSEGHTPRLLGVERDAPGFTRASPGAPQSRMRAQEETASSARPREEELLRVGCHPGGPVSSEGNMIPHGETPARGPDSGSGHAEGRLEHGPLDLRRSRPC